LGSIIGFNEVGTLAINNTSKLRASALARWNTGRITNLKDTIPLGKDVTK
jgi:hypothetical protein